MKLHKFDQEFIDKDLTTLKGDYKNSLFFNCLFDVVKDLTLKNCVLSNSKFQTKNIRDALGFCISLDCKTFHNVELNELMFDLLIMLLIDTKGNDKKRKKLISIIGKKKFDKFKKEFENIE